MTSCTRRAVSLITANAVTDPGGTPSASSNSSGLPKLNRPAPSVRARFLRSTRVDDLVTKAMARERQIEQEIDMLRRQLEASEAIRRGEEAPATEVWPEPEDFDATEPRE